MGIIANSLNKHIQKDNLKKNTQSSAIIIKYDRTSNRASIRYPNPYGAGYLYRENVKLPDKSDNAVLDDINPGDECIVSFTGDNLYAPVIMGIVKDNYNEKTNTDQGAYLIDKEIFEIQKPENIKPMIETWVDEEKDFSNNISDYKNFKELNIKKESYDIMSKSDKYKNKEYGIINIDKGSNIKLDKAGDIEIFTKANTGIRISHDGNIYLYGENIYINNKKIGE